MLFRSQFDLDRPNPIVERYTGVNSNDFQKHEVNDMFGDIDRKNDFVNGNTFHYEKERFIQSKYHQGVPVIEPQYVAPGLNRGVNGGGYGGFHQFETNDLIQDKTVDQLRVKTNPKVSYPGRTIDGQHFIANRTMDPVVSKNRVITYYSWGADNFNNPYGTNSKPTEKSGAFFNKRNDRAKRFDLIAPVSGVQSKVIPTDRDEDELQLTRRNETDREIIGFAGPNHSNNQSHVNFQDNARKTIKETTNASTLLNTSGNESTRVYQIDDVKNTQRAQLTKKSNYTGTAGQSNANKFMKNQHLSAEFNEIREKLETERGPVTTSVKVNRDQTLEGKITQTRTGDSYDDTFLGVTPINSIYKEDIEEQKVHKFATSSIDDDRIETTLIQGFIENPYTQSLASAPPLVE